MNIAFRVDASPLIGTGHVMRCLSLAQELRRLGCHTLFVCRQLIPSLSDRLRSVGQDVVILPQRQSAKIGDLGHSSWLQASQEEDALDTAAALDGTAWDWLVVDHYALDARWEKMLRHRTSRLMVLDDLADRRHDCDVLLDQNLSTVKTSRYANLVPPGCRLLEGCQYALLRPEFRKARVKQDDPAEARLNIFFGGTDPDGMTAIALDALARLPDRRFAVDVIVGGDNSRIAELRRRCEDLNFALHVQPPDMAALFAHATLALGASGTSSWERCCTGLPALIITIADNQVAGAEALARARAALYFGPMSAVDPVRLSVMIERLMIKPRLLKAMRRRAQTLVDGRGIERVAIYLMRRNLSLSPASLDDAAGTWAWRNHPSTREFFHDPAPIAQSHHLAWWQQSLQSPDRDLLIARCGPQAVGVMRFDYQDKEALVSIYLDPELTGIGLGKAVLEAGSHWLKTERPDIERQRAEILPGNLRSRRCFDMAGYQQVDSQTWIRPVGDA